MNNKNRKLNISNISHVLCRKQWGNLFVEKKNVSYRLLTGYQFYSIWVGKISAYLHYISKQLIILISRRRDFKQTNLSECDLCKYNLSISSKWFCNVLSFKCFSVNFEKGSLWRQAVQRNCLNHSITLLQQSSDKRDAQLFR